ncbi:transmembrane protein, putative [Bodo saltans]|uniref:Transmembrane protein, putative n=1 Tax=Bodo saltans TaxID=75058 RepID=A0A0S4IWI0_BODSA|nr:transmembrane protein, putative [Bodo saltans]|eukprot:CUF79550.1 transmembrane protein, putative [Bodo saltans]
MKLHYLHFLNEDKIRGHLLLQTFLINLEKILLRLVSIKSAISCVHCKNRVLLKGKVISQHQRNHGKGNYLRQFKHRVTLLVRFHFFFLVLLPPLFPRLSLGSSPGSFCVWGCSVFSFVIVQLLLSLCVSSDSHVTPRQIIAITCSSRLLSIVLLSRAIL